MGIVPRLSAGLLASSLIPTTLAGHRFWVETDASAHKTQRMQFLKNLAILGGLLLIVSERNPVKNARFLFKKARLSLFGEGRRSS